MSALKSIVLASSAFCAAVAVTAPLWVGFLNGTASDEVGSLLFAVVGISVFLGLLPGVPGDPGDDGA